MDYTLQLLKEAGWYEGRNIDVSKHIEKLKWEFRIEALTDVQVQFLKSFADLKIIYPALRLRRRGKEIGNVKFLNATKTLDTHILKICKGTRSYGVYIAETHARLKHHDKNLVQIAKDPTGLEVFMSEKGNIYGYFDGGFICYGNDVMEMFSAFFHEDKLPVEEIDEEDEGPVPEI